MKDMFFLSMKSVPSSPPQSSEGKPSCYYVTGNYCISGVADVIPCSICKVNWFHEDCFRSYDLGHHGGKYVNNQPDTPACTMCLERFLSNLSEGEKKACSYGDQCVGSGHDTVHCQKCEKHWHHEGCCTSYVE